MEEPLVWATPNRSARAEKGRRVVNFVASRPVGTGAAFKSAPDEAMESKAVGVLQPNTKFAALVLIPVTGAAGKIVATLTDVCGALIVQAGAMVVVTAALRWLAAWVRSTVMAAGLNCANAGLPNPPTSAHSPEATTPPNKRVRATGAAKRGSAFKRKVLRMAKTVSHFGEGNMRSLRILDWVE